MSQSAMSNNRTDYGACIEEAERRTRCCPSHIPGVETVVHMVCSGGHWYGDLAVVSNGVLKVGEVVAIDICNT